MDEVNRERNQGFARLQKDLTSLLQTIAAYIEDQDCAP